MSAASVRLILAAAIVGITVPSFGGDYAAQNSAVTFMRDLQSAPQNQPMPKVSSDRWVDRWAVLAETESKVEKATRKTMPSVALVKVPGGVGSGFIIMPSGILVTNAHVVAPVDVGDEVKIVLGDDNEQTGILLVKGDAEKKDIAFIQLPPAKKGWPALTLKPRAQVSLGSEVLAMGHPMGLPFTVSRGIISGLNRDGLNNDLTFLQTDASINPGNSGGPLVALDGTVVGMNTLIISKSGSSGGLGFAIVADDIIRAWKQFTKIRNLDSPWLGIMADPKMEVQQLIKGSPAKKAGIELGDVIRAFEGKPVKNMDDLLRQMHAHMPGDTVKITIERVNFRKDYQLPGVVWRDEGTGDATVVLESEREIPPQRIAANEADVLPV